MVMGGDDLVVGDLTDAIPLIVRKTSNEAAPLNVAAVQDDDELFVSVEPNSKYLALGFFRYTAGSNTPDLRLNYSYPSGASFARFELGAPAASTATADTVEAAVATSGDTIRGAGTTQRGMIMWGDLQTGGTAGTFRVRFGQGTADAVNAITMNLGSWLVLFKL